MIGRRSLNSAPIGPMLRGALALGALGGLCGCVGVAAPVPPTGTSATCYAGAYVCQMAQQVPIGAQCTCPAIGAPSYGVVR